MLCRSGQSFAIHGAKNDAGEGIDHVDGQILELSVVITDETNESLGPICLDGRQSRLFGGGVPDQFSHIGGDGLGGGLGRILSGRARQRAVGGMVWFRRFR